MKRRKHHSKGYYDPQPPRRHRGHRRGIEPAGLKRWRLAHRRTHDPGYQRSLWKGPRGGHYFRGPRKNRYDPQPRRRSYRSAVGRAGRGIEGALNKWGTALGFALGMGAGVYQGYTKEVKANGSKNAGTNYLNGIIGGPIKNDAGALVRTAVPEVSHLWATNDPGGYNTVPYLKYKFLGTDPTGNNVGSAWVIPFWASLGTWIGSIIGMKIGKLGKLHRFLRPVSKIAKGATIGTLIGALTLPGCGKNGPQGIPPPPNTLAMTQTSPGHFAPATPIVEYTYKG